MFKKIFFTISLVLFGVLANAQTQYYNGTIDGDEIDVKITWKKDGSIFGSYNFIYNSSRIYKLSGTNYVNGEIEITESYNGKRTGSGTLKKTLKKGSVVWSGYIYNTDGTKSFISFTRYR